MNGSVASAFILMVVAYLIGSLPFGLLVGFARGVDVRKAGSGNIGATNVGRVLGTGYGLAVFALDLLKGFVPVLAAGRWLVDPTDPAATLTATAALIWLGVAAACILGHIFPVYLNFKGGKGVATSLGVLLGVYPYYTWPGLVVFGLWIVVTLTTRYVSVGSIVAASAFPIVFSVFAYWYHETWGTVSDLWPLYGFAVVIACLVFYRHRGNLARLRAGTESKIGSSRSAPADRQSE